MEKDTKRVKVSIVVTNYNYKIYLRECLISCLEQTIPLEDYEVIVVDDCSTDDSQGFLREYVESFNHPNLRAVFNNRNMGYSYCKNIGIKLANGEFIVHLDSDDMLTKDSLEARLYFFNKRPELEMVHGLAWRWRDGKKDGYNKNSKIHAQGVMIRKSVYERCGYYDEELRSKSDKLMWYRLGVHPKSGILPKIRFEKIRSFVAYYRKHDEQMHKIRRKNKKLNKLINDLFEKKVNEIKKKEN